MLIEIIPDFPDIDGAGRVDFYHRFHDLLRLCHSLIITDASKDHSTRSGRFLFNLRRHIGTNVPFIDANKGGDFEMIDEFKNALQIKEVASFVPLDRLLVETDAPYLAPVPYRGKQNHPALVLHVAEEIAKLRGIDLEQLTRATTDNFFRLFGAANRA